MRGQDVSGVIQYALSLKQPWAGLLVHGHKTIEVRRWATGRRGRILIHAARIPDDRDEAWEYALRWPEVSDTVLLNGGLIGAGDLVDCVTYRSRDAFRADEEKHLNKAEWFEPPLLYGFRFDNLSVLPYRRYPGWMRFFSIEERFAGQE